MKYALLLTLALSINAQTAAPPPVVATFESNVEGAPDIFPADAAGAVGPNHVVGVSNGGFVVQSRSGQVLQYTPLSDFWIDPPFTTGAYYDSHIVYDAAADRWVMAAIWENNFQFFGMTIAASKTGDPTGEWHRFQIDLHVPGRFIDFTRLGMTSDRIIVTYDANGGSLIVSMLKADLYNGNGTYQTAMGPSRDLHPVTFIDGSSTDAYLLASDNSGVLNVYRLDGSNLTQTAHYTSDPWSLPPPSPFLAPQLDSTRLMDAGDTSVQAAIARKGVVWAVNMIVTSIGGPQRTSIRWWRFVLGGVSAETGTLDDPTGTTFYGFPGIAVNRLGAAVISYCYYSASIHPSFGFSYRDPAGVMSARGTISNGTNVPSERRWGDYTTAVVDPANDLDFWATGPSATSQIWTTWWGEIRPPFTPARIRAVRH